MGDFLSVANKEHNHTIFGKSADMRFCATGIQGWRNNMEDAHVGICDMGDGNSFFGVFDGHGGPEVSDWVADHIVEELKQNVNY